VCLPVPIAPIAPVVPIVEPVVPIVEPVAPIVEPIAPIVEPVAPVVVPIAPVVPVVPVVPHVAVCRTEYMMTVQQKTFDETKRDCTNLVGAGSTKRGHLAIITSKDIEDKIGVMRK